MQLLIIPAAIPLIAAGITAAAGAYSTWRNNRNQKKQNEADRQFQREQYERMRKDALTDADSANKYNSPEEQMNRLRQAGLNPHLVYGKGADQAAVAIRGSNFSGGTMPAPKVDTEFASNAMASYFNAQQAQVAVQNAKLTTDNIAKQGELMEKEKLLKDAQTFKTIADTDYKKGATKQLWSLMDLKVKDAELKNKISELNQEKIVSQIKGIDAGTQFRLAENIRSGRMNEVRVKKALVDIGNAKLQGAKTEQETEKIKKSMQLMDKDIVLKDLTRQLNEYEISLNKAGVQKNDPLWQRMMLKKFQEFSDWLFEPSGIEEEE